MKRLLHRIAQLVFCVCLMLLAYSSNAETITKIPVAKGLASHPVNGGRCLISDGEHQYLAFYDAQHQMTVAQRKLGGTNWRFTKLPEKVGWDTHNKILMFLDRDGFIHVTGNMHCASLKYYRSRKPHDIQTFDAIHKWSGKNENRVTYPSLLILRDGSLHMMYRHGGSGNGKRILVHYNEKDQTWTGTGEAFISGMDHKPTCNAYPFGVIKEDAKGVLHIAWCWRETPDVETNHDICYAKSLDGGHTWMRWDGTKYELPIRPENAEVADDIAQRSGLMNGGSLAIDKDGNPYIGYTRFDENGFNQMYVATPQNGQWKIVQVSNLNKKFWFEGRGTIPESPSIPRVSWSGGKLHIREGNKELIVTRNELLELKAEQLVYHKASQSGSGLPHIRTTNSGPLPKGQKHYMQQQVDKPNRDRKPDNPKEPTMIYVVEVDSLK